MLKTITLKKKYRCFEEGDSFEFRPGVNLLVGDQGMGKSTLLHLMKESAGKSGMDNSIKGEKLRDIFEYKADPIAIAAFDFEKDNPRIQSAFDQKMDMGFQVSARFASHGQVLRSILASMREVKDPTLFLLDEPDASLSPRSTFNLAEMLKHVASKGCQVLAAVHNPIVITAFPEVLSLEHRRWMPSDEFIESQKKPLPKEPVKRATRRQEP